MSSAARSSLAERSAATERSNTFGSPLGTVRRAVGFAVLAFRGFLQDEGLHRASALAFDTALGIVPLLAFLVAALKGFGSYDELVINTIRPIADRMLTGIGDRSSELVSLHGAFMTLLAFVDRTDFSALGVLGLVTLLYIVVLLLMSVEASMNHIFGVARSRGAIRKITDYAAILFITPLSAMLAGAVATFAQKVNWPAAGFLLQLAVIFAMGLGLSALYLVMPFAKVRLSSALLGGFVAGLLSYFVLVAHVSLQLGVARYNAIYSTFAAIPLFLVWVFTTWVVVLYGAELSALHRDHARFRWKVEGQLVSHGARRYAGLRALLAVGHAFQQGAGPLTTSFLARELGVPTPLLERVLEQLSSRGLLVRTEQQGERAYVPARPLESLRLSQLVDALDDSPENGALEARSVLDRAARQALEELSAKCRDPERDPTLGDLVHRLDAQK